MKRAKSVYLSLGALLVLSIFFIFLCKSDDEIYLDAFSDGRFGTVVIDAGHGGEDGGAVGYDGVLEKELNLKISQKLCCIFELFGIPVDMTRTADISLSENTDGKLRERKIADIKARVERIANTPSATLISIHQNSFPADASCEGAQVFYSDNNSMSKTLAESMQASLKKGLAPGNNRVAKSADKNIYILKNVNCPAVLVECGFLTNHKEAELLKDDIYQTKVAVCIASGFWGDERDRGSEDE